MDDIINRLKGRLVNNYDKIVYKTSCNETFIFEKINDSIITSITPYYNSTYIMSFEILAWCILNDIGINSVDTYNFDELDNMLKIGKIKLNPFYDWGKVYRDMNLK